VPCDMAVECPETRIIRREPQDHPAVRRDENRVASKRVHLVQLLTDISTNISAHHIRSMPM